MFKFLSYLFTLSFINYLVFYLPKIVLVRLANYADLHDENGG